MTVATHDSSLSESTQRLLSISNGNGNNSVPVQQHNNIVGVSSGGKKQQQLIFHALPPGVKITNALATDGVKCHFTKHLKCKFKNTDIVICIRCENAVHVQCFCIRF